MKKKKIVIAVVVLVVVIAAGIFAYWYTQIKIPHDRAVAEYQVVADDISSKNAELDEAIANVQTLIDSGRTPLDESYMTDAQVSVATAQESRIEMPGIPDDTGTIESVTEEYRDSVDYTTTIADLSVKGQALENSYKQMEQLTNPPESFVIERLSGLPNIVDIEAATEDKDPNGNLNKAGGYTAAVFFSSDLIDQSKLYSSGKYGGGVLDKGTDGGGCIEVFATVEDAQKRNDYLAIFDGSILSSGSHRVAGTVLIRTSSELTASQQQAMEENIYQSLIALK